METTWLTDSIIRIDDTMIMLAQKPANVPVQPYQESYGNRSEWMPYGDKDDYPNTIAESAKKNSIIRTALEYKANVMSSGELQFGYNRWDKTLKTKVFEQIHHPDVETFAEYNDIKSYFFEALRDLYWWNMAYADLVKASKDSSKPNNIVQLSTVDHLDVRLERQERPSGKIKHAYINGNWGDTLFKKANNVKVPLIDPWYLDTDAVVNNPAKRFIFPMFFPVPGQKYYHPASWHSVVLSGWVTYLDKIPEFKSYMLSNLMHIRYVIHIPDKWWTLKYGNDFFTKPVEVRKPIMDREFTAFQETLTGTKNAGKAILATYITSHDGRELSKWQIEPLKTDIGSGELIPESQEGANNILFALALHASLIGNTPGKGMGAGSGSDIRVSFNNLIIANTAHQYKVAKAFEYITRCNGWRGPGNEPIVCRINNDNFIQTLNQLSPEKREAANNVNNNKDGDNKND